MADYISREAAIALTDQHCFETSYDAVWMEEELRKLPAADVQPIVKAEWLSRMNGTGICSNCHRLDHIDPLAAHCRFCRSEMIKDKRDCENN